MSHFVIDNELTLADHKQMAEYKGSYFAAEMIIPPEITYEWYLYNPDTFVAVRDTQTSIIAGHLNILPFHNEILNEFLAGKLDDSVFSVSFLKGKTNIIRRYDEPGEYFLYLSSAAVDPRYLRSRLFSMMVNAFGQVLLRLAQKDIYIAVLIANATTSEGVRLCRYFKMKPGIITTPNIYLSTDLTDFSACMKKSLRNELLTAYKGFNSSNLYY